MYEKVKNVLWDMFPQWEDLHYDAAFKEMLWASEGGMCHSALLLSPPISCMRVRTQQEGSSTRGRT